MPRYNFDYGGNAFSRAIQPGINDLLRGIEEYKKNATEGNVDIQRLQLESAKSGAWQGYQPSNAGTGSDPNVAQNYPDVMTEQGKEAYRMGGQSRIQSLQGISDIEKQKNYIDELSKRETMLGQSVDRRIKAVNASDTWLEKAFKDRESGNSSPEMFAGQIETAMEMSATGGRDLSKYNLDVSKFAKLSDLKATLKNADTEGLANAYKSFLGSEKLEDKIDNAAVLGKVLPAYKQKYGVPDGSYKFMDDALEKFNTTKFDDPQKNLPYKIGQRLPVREEGDQNVTDVVVGYDKDGLPITKSISRGIRFKPEDTAFKLDRIEEKRQLLEEKKQQKKQEAKNSLDKWFTDAVTKAGGELASTSDGGFELVNKSFYERGKGPGNPKINSLKTVYDKALKGIEKTYGTEKTDWQPNKNDLRQDGSQKGNGWLGVLAIKYPDGKSGAATEYTVGVRINGKETNIPTLVPTLTQKEIKLMTEDIIPNRKKVPKEILGKAIQHAKERIDKGKSVFADEKTKDKFGFTTGETKAINGKTYTYIGNDQWEY